MTISWQFPYPSQRMPVLARNVVATSQPLAAQAGLRMLLKGGNAVDAALATAIALTVVEPTSNGIGSDAFALVWDGAKLHGLNGSGRSPRAWTLDRFAGLSPCPVQWIPGCSCPKNSANCHLAIYLAPPSITLKTVLSFRQSQPYAGRRLPSCTRIFRISATRFYRADALPAPENGSAALIRQKR